MEKKLSGRKNTKGHYRVAGGTSDLIKDVC